MSTETKTEQATHTPGPWELKGERVDGKCIFVENDHDGWHRLAVEVDSDDCDTATAWANARLIAAAPELLEACRAALPLISAEADRRRDSGVPGYETEMDDLAGVLRAALAKAGEGGSG